MAKKIRPVIKWTGGKFDEFDLFAEYIPKFNRYIEPFFGGGGVYFALKPTVPSFINDKSTDLINFYSEINKDDLKTELYKYVDAWYEMNGNCEQLWGKCGNNYIEFVKGRLALGKVQEMISIFFTQILSASSLFRQFDFIIDFTQFEKIILTGFLDKAKRVKRIIETEKRNFTKDELRVHFETGIRSGVYLFFRYILNKAFKNLINLSPAKAAANWYFVREFCYGSMFRFNKKNEFNIPYGGIAYNKKNFKRKVDLIFNPIVRELFNRAQIFNLDFEQFFNAINPKSTDFIFLDPPYDSEFSEYDQSSFTRNDQERLASVLLGLAAKWMLVIKETDFIKTLYDHPNIKINTFTKKYRYNMMGRNSRGVTHLIICNY